MTVADPVCDHREVHHRALLIGLFCLILAIVRISGVHEHFSPDHLHDAPSGALESVVGFAVDDHDSDHVSAHLEHGDIDVDVAAKGAGKVPALSVPVALAVFLVLLFVTPVRTSLQRCPPPSRPPKWRRRFYLIPPAQAPPFAA